jgi:hypothetical protein
MNELLNFHTLYMPKEVRRYGEHLASFLQIDHNSLNSENAQQTLGSLTKKNCEQE